MSERLQTRVSNKSRTCPLSSSKSKFLNKNLKSLVFQPHLLQTKLAISHQKDKYEQEADLVQSK